MHRVAILVLEGVVPFDLSVPCEVFGRVRLADGTAPYDVRVCGPEGHVSAGHFGIAVRHGLGMLARARTIFVPGTADVSAAIAPRVLRALRDAAARGARIASICSGAFVLAAAGLLDGRRATTHWLATGELARRYPTVTVDPNVLFVDDGAVLTSAGAAAGLDLCLHMVRNDYGAAIAASAARLSVMPLERAGGQAQFIVQPPPEPNGGSLEPLLRWIEAHTGEAPSLAALARRAGTSTRTLSRRFAEQTGTTPQKYVAHARVRRAQALLESSGESVERIAGRVGFGSAITFRTAFRRLVGTSPKAYRAAFRAGP